MKNKSLFSRLLNNKKILLILSFALALMFWIISSDNVAVTINGVPIKYSLSDSADKDLKVFGFDIDTVSVEVKGKRVVIDSLKPEDINATIDLSDVTGPTTASFDINVKNNLSGYDVQSVEPDSLKLVIDREATKTVPLVDDFDMTNINMENYYVNHDAPKEITVTGPESYVEKVQCAYISGAIKDDGSGTVTNTYKVKLYNTKDLQYVTEKNEVDTRYLTLSSESIDVTFDIMRHAELPIEIKYSDASGSIDNYYDIKTPSNGKLHVAGDESVILSGKIMLNIGSMSEFKNIESSITYDVDDVLMSNTSSNNKLMELDTTVKITVEYDFSSLSSRTVSIPARKIQIKNMGKEYSYTPKEDISVTVYGEKDVIDSLKYTDFTVTYDFNNATISNGNTFMKPKVTVKINATGLCWAYKMTPTVEVTKIN